MKLGDLIERITYYTGIKWLWKKLYPNCKCKERQDTIKRYRAMVITNEDNMELMARYEDNHFDLAIVDPPYGDF